MGYDTYIPTPIKTKPNTQHTEGRLEILKIKTRNMKLAPDIDLALVGKDTHGFVGTCLLYERVRFLRIGRWRGGGVERAATTCASFPIWTVESNE